MKRTFLRKTDFWILLLVLAALAVWLTLRFAGGARTRAQVFLDSVLIAELPLDREQVFPVPGKPEVQLQVREGACGFVHSDCPDQICVNSGFLSIAGQSAACLPNRVVLRIVSDSAELDTAVS